MLEDIYPCMERVRLVNFLHSKEEIWNLTATRKTIEEKNKSGKTEKRRVPFFS
jgi:hypothetical protein